jgi:hypothetical protein
MESGEGQQTRWEGDGEAEFFTWTRRIDAMDSGDSDNTTTALACGGKREACDTCGVRGCLIRSL